MRSALVLVLGLASATPTPSDPARCTTRRATDRPSRTASSSPPPAATTCGCAGKNRWTWSNQQRDSCGTAFGCRGTIWIDVGTPGEQVVRFSQREDGFEFDEFLLTTDADDTPEGTGSDEVRR